MIGADRNSEIGQVAEQLASHAQTLVDAEGTVDIRVVDEALPAHGCAGLLTNEKVNMGRG